MKPSMEQNCNLKDFMWSAIHLPTYLLHQTISSLKRESYPYIVVMSINPQNASSLKVLLLMVINNLLSNTSIPG